MPTTTKQFVDAMRGMVCPGGRVPELLKYHAGLSGRVGTVTNLAKAVRYRSYDGVNLQYGILAARIAARLRNPEARHLGLLMEFVHPKKQSNAHYQLVMRLAFYEALKLVDWI
jgi:hypothetical protein